MAHINTWRAVVLAVAILGPAGCAQQVAAEEVVPEKAVKVEAVAGTDLSKVSLSKQAIARLGVQTEAVRAAPAADAAIVSFSAVLYDAHGDAWVFTSPAPLSFVRAPIVVDRVEGDVAYLLSGPKVGTTVVTVGVQELYGAEYGVGGE